MTKKTTAKKTVANKASASKTAATAPIPLTLTENSIDLNSADYYFNRELSHLAFNQRVLAQSLDDDHPLLERLRFLLIFSSNLDEFFEIRVANLKKDLLMQREIVGMDGQHPVEILSQISQICHENIALQYTTFNNVLLLALANENIRFLARNLWTPEQELWVKRYVKKEIMPIISPIGLDPAHPFPRLVNKSLNFIVSLEGKDAFGRETGLAIIPAPRSLPRLVRLPNELCQNGDNLVFLSSMIHAHAHRLFPGMKVNGCYQFRITRNADLDLDGESVQDLALALRGELHTRRFGRAVRLEVADNCPEPLVDFLLNEAALTREDLYLVNGPVNLNRLMEIMDLVNRTDLTYPLVTPKIPRGLNAKDHIFDSIRNKQNYLLHHPYESFAPVIELLLQAAKDPNVLAIKQTLYRTGNRSPVVNALIEAARSGKEVTAVIELRARFDEEDNLELASRLQEAGAVVVYGVVDYKTHAKMLLIVRRENKKLVRYVHLGTGNYHASTTRIYTDYSLISSDSVLAEDVHRIFRQLTGMGKTEAIEKMLNAPFNFKQRIIEFIEVEAETSKVGGQGHIILKTNALTDTDIIQALYKASQAGVKIDLIVRGMCCLRPQTPGVSENIHVRSIVGRFLEHSRVYYFKNSSPGLYGASADMMERSLNRRVETGFPIEDADTQKRVLEELQLYLEDDWNSWTLLSNGRYRRNRGDANSAVQVKLLTNIL
ncbi:MAG: polyphosphate kinase [Cellvibrionaceae bacterium]|jgi:polyphosphate kinase